MKRKTILQIFILLQSVSLMAQKPASKSSQNKMNFKQEEVTFLNGKDSVRLAGTFTYPESGDRFPTVILISGSGPSDRDETIFYKHKPFKVIAEYLSKNGYAVLRYDDRGAGSSTGKPFPKHTSVDLMGDVLAAINFLKAKNNVLPGKIGLIGHSEGGMIAAMVASRSTDVAYVISLAGPGCKIDEVMTQQNRLLLSPMGKAVTEHYLDLCYKPIMKSLLAGTDSLTMYKNICTAFANYRKAVPDTEYNSIVMIADTSLASIFMQQMYNPWFRYFLSYNPATDWKNVKQPVLALNGTKDTQVDAAQNLACIKESLTEGNNKNFKVLSLEGYNHLFQKAKTGSPMEYVSLNEAISPNVLAIMLKWMKELPL